MGTLSICTEHNMLLTRVKVDLTVLKEMTVRDLHAKLVTVVDQPSIKASNQVGRHVRKVLLLWFGRSVKVIGKIRSPKKVLMVM